MTQKKLNVAIIGGGSITHYHSKGVLANPNCNLYAICDNATDDRLAQKAEKYHPEITCAFLHAGKPVLLEKPTHLPAIEGASTIAVCTATVEAAKLGHPVQITYPQI